MASEHTNLKSNIDKVFYLIQNQVASMSINMDDILTKVDAKNNISKEACVVLHGLANSLLTMQEGLELEKRG